MAHAERHGEDQLIEVRSTDGTRLGVQRVGEGPALLAVHGSASVQRVVRNRLVEGRELERGNAHPGSIGRDFGRFGFEVWRELHRRDKRTAEHNESLALLNDARNGLAHSDEAKLASLRDKGHPLVLSSFRRWRRDLDILAANLDAETSAQLARLFDREHPW